MRFNLRRLSRRLSTSLTFIFLLAIVGGIVAEFFIELGKEWGWYDKPAERLGAAMTAFSDFVTQTWFLILAAFLTGTTVGLWIDTALRRREAALALRAVPQKPALAGEPGHLDYVVEGIQSLNDITAIFQSTTKDTNRMVQTMARYALMFRVVQNFNRRRKLTTRFSAKLNKFSEKMREYGPLIADAGKRTHVNCLAMIEGSSISDHDTLNALLNFANTLQQMVESSASSAAAMNEARSAVSSIVGISREMNAAAELYSTTMEALSAETRAYSDICNRLLTAANAKATRAAAMLANQAGYPLSQPLPDMPEGTPL